MRSLIFPVFLLVFAAGALAMPQIPVGYYGTVYDEDGIAYPDVEVSVRSDGIIWTTAVTDPEGYYSIIVPWDDPETSSNDGVFTGETIEFYVDGIFIKATTVGEQGSDTKFDIETKILSGSSSSSGSDVSGSSGTGASSGNPDEDDLPDDTSKQDADQQGAENKEDDSVPDSVIQAGSSDAKKSDYDISAGKDDEMGSDQRSSINDADIPKLEKDLKDHDADISKSRNLFWIYGLFGTAGIIILMLYFFKKERY